MQILCLFVKRHIFTSAVVNRNSIAIYENTYSHCFAENHNNEENVHFPQLESKKKNLVICLAVLNAPPTVLRRSRRTRHGCYSCIYMLSDTISVIKRDNPCNNNSVKSFAKISV
jgi:hypothetical protein